MELEKKYIKKLQSASSQMLKSLKNDNLTREEKYEWYGYIRSLRDCAYDAGILSKTKIQENLEEALKIIRKTKTL